MRGWLRLVAPFDEFAGTVPKLPAPNVATGALYCGWLKALKYSALNWRTIPSLIAVFFARFISQFLVESARNVESTRLSLPKAHGPALTKAAVLNHVAPFCPVARANRLPPAVFDTPGTTLGRVVPA